MKNKCYVVTEFGGQWEDKWERILKVFLSEDKAKEYVTLHSEIKKDSLKIEVDKYLDLEEKVWKLYPNDITSESPELILKSGLCPEATLEDLRKTEEFIQRDIYDWTGMRIEEHELCQ